MSTSSDTTKDSAYISRLVDLIIPELLSGLPALSFVGPRGGGKTTTAARYAASIAHLNRSDDAALFTVDADAALQTYPRPTLLDEWQAVPPVLAAVKRQVDTNPLSGQFILAGSVHLPVQQTWPATGRVASLPIFSLTRREIAGTIHHPLFLDRLLEPTPELFAPASGQNDLFTYLDMAFDGGFPDLLLHRRGRARRLWLSSYLNNLLSSDIAQTGTQPDTDKLSAFVQALATNSAGVVDETTLFDAAHIGRATANTYDNLLESVYFSERVPAWWSDRLTRLTALPKRYVLDTALLLSVLRVDKPGLTRNPNLIGRVLDSFVAMQLRPEVAISDHEPRLHHLRTKQGRQEVDLIVEYGSGRVGGIEVKATSAPGLDDARHLIWLRDQLSDDFVGGVVLHTGPHSFTLSPRIIAAPISTLWA